MTWGFVWLILILKIPIGGLLYIVWWAVHQTDEPEAAHSGGGGGTKRPVHPHGPLPRAPRRGQHKTPAPTAPPRVRSVVARARGLPRV